MGSSPYTTLILIVVMVVAFYFLILRPQRKRQQSQQNTLNSLVPGTKVLTGSGLFGTIVAIGDRQAVLEIAPGVELTVLKQAIARVAGPQDEDDTLAGPVDDDDDDDPSDAPEALEEASSDASTSDYPSYEADGPTGSTADDTTNDRPGDERRREDS